jgi:hypothetical protein
MNLEERRTILKRFVTEYGLDLVAAYSAKKNEAKVRKIKLFKEDKTAVLRQELTTEKYVERIEAGYYDDGYVVCSGIIRHGQYKDHKLAYLDIDSKLGLHYFCDYGDRGITIEQLADNQYIEFNGIDKDQRVHIPYILTPDAELSPKGEDDKLHIKVDTAGVMFAAGSPHHNGGFYMQMGKSDKIKVIDKTLAFALQEHIRSICEGNRVNYFDKNNDEQKAAFHQAYSAHLHDDGTRIKKGGRHETVKFICCSYFNKYSDEWDNLTDDQRFERVLGFDKMHCDDPLSETDPTELEELWSWTKKTFRVDRDKAKEAREETRSRIKEEVRKKAPLICENKWNLTVTFRQEIRDGLDGNVWTIISSEPYKFIVAVRRYGHICRASVKYSDLGNGDTKTCHLIFGTIIMRVFPKQVTEHESPLKFLESPPEYTIVFENQKHEEFAVKGSIEEILTRLNEKGLVVSSYGAKEALNAVVEAFRDDGRISIDRSVDFEGYYYHDGDIHTSKVNFDEKHPVRNKEDILSCIDYLETRATFQIWDYKGTKIDRRDLLASAIQWTIAAPFNFAIKQITKKYYQKAFDMTGERDGGKSGLSQEMLNMHGNHTEQKDVDSPYSVAAGSMNTEAKFGKGVSKTTYPIEISEFGTVESYGRNENLVEIIKTAIEGLIVRRGRDGGRYDAPFASCSPFILNGNPFISRKGEIIKRLHVAKFSEEDRHDRSPTSPFNVFKDANGHKIKTLGDWTIKYILDNKEELLLSGKYTGYEIAKKAIHEFYNLVGKEVPDWLTRWIVDTTLEELDLDDESLIRSILYDHVLKTLQSNARFIEFGNREVKVNNYGNEYLAPKISPINLDIKISLCIDNGLWSWLRKKRLGLGETLQEYYIDASILELFSRRLPNLDIQKLGAKTGFKYTQKHGGVRLLKCTKTQLIEFIKGKEIEEDPKVDTSHGNIEGVKE